jgi:hypothetical protein
LSSKDGRDDTIARVFKATDIKARIGVTTQIARGVKIIQIESVATAARVAVREGRKVEKINKSIYIRDD